MTYLWLDLAGAPPDAELTFVADWELPAVFRWSLVKVDKNGAEAGRVERRRRLRQLATSSARRAASTASRASSSSA